MRVAVITVGDELLVGDTVNTNAAWLGQQLDAQGARVERVITVPDRVEDIANEVTNARATYDAVVVTGGIGPTHDDVTLDGVAAAFDVDVEPHEAAIDWFDNHAEYSQENVLEGTDHLPVGARMLVNPEGVAPGAVLTGEDDVPVYVFPGVPAEMKRMFETVATEFSGTRRSRRFLETDEPESSLIQYFEDIRERFAVSVGSYPGEHVRVKIEGQDEREVQRALEWLRGQLE